MKSQHGDFFNHDDEAAGYDADVLNEEHPIRAGYQDVLGWVTEMSAVKASDAVLDLGCGTANLSLRLPPFGRLVCVDISEKMLAIARQKLSHLESVSYVQTDLLAYFADAPAFDVVVSTYACHHLTADEKPRLFESIYRSLAPGGRAVFGDLMFADRGGQDQLLESYRQSGQGQLADDIEEEFFWLVDEAEAQLSKLGFQVTSKRFSDLSWGISATK